MLLDTFGDLFKPDGEEIRHAFDQDEGMDRFLTDLSTSFDLNLLHLKKGILEEMDIKPVTDEEDKGEKEKLNSHSHRFSQELLKSLPASTSFPLFLSKEFPKPFRKSPPLFPIPPFMKGGRAGSYF